MRTRIGVFTRLLLVISAAQAPGARGAERQTLAPAGPPRHAIVREGQPAATIVLPAKPGPLEAHAAAELRKYVQAISGATLEIVHEPSRPRGYALRLGRTGAAKAAGFSLTQEKLGRDGYAACAVCSPWCV